MCCTPTKAPAPPHVTHPPQRCVSASCIVPTQHIGGADWRSTSTTSAASFANQSRSSGLLEGPRSTARASRSSTTSVWCTTSSLAPAPSCANLSPRAPRKPASLQAASADSSTIGATLYRPPVCRRHHASRRPRGAGSPSRHGTSTDMKLFQLPSLAWSLV